MKATDKSPVWESTIAAERVDQCRTMLHIHGFLSDSEDARVDARITKWAKKDGVTRRPAVVRKSKAALGDFIDKQQSCNCGKRECSQCGEDPAAYAGT